MREHTWITSISHSSSSLHMSYLEVSWKQMVTWESTRTPRTIQLWQVSELINEPMYRESKDVAYCTCLRWHAPRASAKAIGIRHRTVRLRLPDSEALICKTFSNGQTLGCDACGINNEFRAGFFYYSSRNISRTTNFFTTFQAANQGQWCNTFQHDHVSCSRLCLNIPEKGFDLHSSDFFKVRYELKDWLWN